MRIYTALALCQSDAATVAAAQVEAAGGKAPAKGGGGAAATHDDAAKTLQRAYDTAAAAKLTELQKDVARLQVHLATLAAAAGGKGAKAGGGGAAGGAGKPGAKGAAAALDEEGALRLIQAVLTGRPDRAVAEQQLREAVAKVDPKVRLGERRSCCGSPPCSEVCPGARIAELYRTAHGCP